MRLVREAATTKTVLGALASLAGACIGTGITWVQLSPARNVKIIPLSVIGSPKPCEVQLPELAKLYDKIAALDNQGYGLLSPVGAPDPATLARLRISPEFAIRVYSFLQRINPSIAFPEDAITTRIQDLQEKLWRAYVDEMNANTPSDKKKETWKRRTAEHFNEAARLMSQSATSKLLSPEIVSVVSEIQNSFYEDVFKTYGSHVLPDKIGGGVLFPQLVAQLNNACSRLSNVKDGKTSCQIPGDIVQPSPAEKDYLLREKVIDSQCFAPGESSLDNGFTVTALLSMGISEHYAFKQDCRLLVNDDRMRFDLTFLPNEAEGRNARPDLEPVMIFGDSTFVRLRAQNAQDPTDKSFSILSTSGQPYSVELECATFKRGFFGFPGGTTSEVTTRVSFFGTRLDTRPSSR